MTDAARHRIDPDALRAFVTKVYKKAGASADDAHIAADAMVQADLWGHQSHGVLRLNWYYARLSSGAMKAETQLSFPVDAGAIAVMDGHDSIGPVVAKVATLDAIARAKAHGIGAVSVRNSNHFGTCMYYTRMAAERGCIMLCMTNGGPNMAPYSGLRKMIGTNPWSIAAPAGRHAPMVMVSRIRAWRAARFSWRKSVTKRFRSAVPSMRAAVRRPIPSKA
ncbi:Malate dehydrogenase [Candidatus Burkholderia humilis]|nr:Malate dehydrogenase [Candidatus Burkholderia humilis]